jgi:hypothetical protein
VWPGLHTVAGVSSVPVTIPPQQSIVTPLVTTCYSDMSDTRTRTRTRTRGGRRRPGKEAEEGACAETEGSRQLGADPDISERPWASRSCSSELLELSLAFVCMPAGRSSLLRPRVRAPRGLAGDVPLHSRERELPGPTSRYLLALGTASTAGYKSPSAWMRYYTVHCGPSAELKARATASTASTPSLSRSVGHHMAHGPSRCRASCAQRVSRPSCIYNQGKDAASKCWNILHPHG